MIKMEVRDVDWRYTELHDLLCRDAIKDWVATRRAQSVDIWRRITNANNVVNYFTTVDNGVRYIVKNRLDLLPVALRISNLETCSSERAICQALEDYYELYEQATGHPYKG